MTCHICKQEDHSYRVCPNRFKVFQNTMGSWITSGLFQELRTQWDSKSDRAIYTIKPYDFNGLPSIHRLYLQYDNLTEYQFANECLGGWDHWQTILSSNRKILQDCIAVWRADLEAKLKSQAFDRIKNEAEADGRNGFAANRFILEKSWAGEFSKPKIAKETQKRGRPSKEEISSAAAQIAQTHKQINSDFERLIGNDGTLKERPDQTESA